jgi:hypothetical protein
MLQYCTVIPVHFLTKPGGCAILVAWNMFVRAHFKRSSYAGLNHDMFKRAAYKIVFEL